jgi:hypothetical protein
MFIKNIDRQSKQSGDNTATQEDVQHKVKLKTHLEESVLTQTALGL